MPYRLELAGGWLDQPSVSSLKSGSVVVTSVQLQADANERSGLAGSTRETAMRLWGGVLPVRDSVTQARFLFGAENPPGTETISGSQDALGILLPGINRLDYTGKFWPEHIDSLGDEETYDWLERHIALVPLGPRPASLDVASTQGITATNAQRLAEGSAEFLEGLERHDLDRIGRSFSTMLAAQAAMFPAMLPDTIRPVIQALAANSHGVKFTGAGGGGYLLVASSVSVPGAVPYHIRRPCALQD
jgi:galactokinase/mevalonate kinase-like predicted kinase